MRTATQPCRSRKALVTLLPKRSLASPTSSRPSHRPIARSRRVWRKKGNRTPGCAPTALPRSGLPATRPVLRPVPKPPSRPKPRWRPLPRPSWSLTWAWTWTRISAGTWIRALTRRLIWSWISVAIWVRTGATSLRPHRMPMARQRTIRWRPVPKPPLMCRRPGKKCRRISLRMTSTALGRTRIRTRLQTLAQTWTRTLARQRPMKLRSKNGLPSWPGSRRQGKITAPALPRQRLRPATAVTAPWCCPVTTITGSPPRSTSIFRLFPQKTRR